MKNLFIGYLTVSTFIFCYFVTDSPLAHHSFAAQYDADKPIELMGVVTCLLYTSPSPRD